MLKAIRRTGETRIILDCSFDKIEAVLKQADSVGLVTDYYNYFITSLVRLNYQPVPFLIIL